MNRTQRKWSRLVRGPKRRAVVMIVAGIGLPCALILCGLVIDVGNVCVARAELGRSADAAALAGTAELLPKSALNGGTPDPSVLANQAWEKAREYVQENPCRDVSRMELSQGDTVLTHYRHDEHDPNLSEFILNSYHYNSTKVTVRRDSQQNGPIPLFFGGLVGLPSINAQGESAAFLERDFEGFGIQPGSTATSKLLPFSLWEGLDENGNQVFDEDGEPLGWEGRALLGNDEFTHHSENQTVSRGGDGIYEIRLFPEKNKDIPGNFGTVDIGNPNNSTADLRRQILHGPNAYDFSFFPNNEVRINEIDHEYPLHPDYPEGRKVLRLNGDTGISAAIKDDLYAIRGQPRILPIHWKAIGNGNNAEFRVVKFVGVTIVDVKLTGALVDKYIKIQPCYTVDGTALGGGRDGETSEYMYKPPRLRRIKDGK